MTEFDLAKYSLPDAGESNRNALRNLTSGPQDEQQPRPAPPRDEALHFQEQASIRRERSHHVYGDGASAWDLEGALNRINRAVSVARPVPLTIPVLADNGAGNTGPDALNRRANASAVRPKGYPFARLLFLGMLWIALVGASTGAAYVFAARGTPLYGGRVELLYDTQDADASTAERQLATQIALARSRGVLAPVVQAVGGLTADDLQRQLNAEVVAKSSVLRFTVTDGNPERALELVRQLSTQYRIAAQPAELSAAAPNRPYETDLVRLQTYLEQRLQSLSGGPDPQLPQPGGQAAPDTQDRLAEELDLRERLSDVRRRLSDLRAQGAPSQRVRVVSDAYVLEHPVEPRPLQGAAAGALVGIVMATLGVGALSLLPSFSSVRALRTRSSWMA